MQVGQTIYLDYQASTPVDERVLRVIHTASAAHFANPHSADHVLGWRAAAAIKVASAQVGELFGLQGEDVIFTSGASESNAMAVRTAEAIASSSQRTELLIGAADHGSILNEAENSRLTVKRIALNKHGAPDHHHLRTLLNDSTALVSIVGVNNENGAISDLTAHSDLCRSRGILLHVDLSQAPLAMDIDLLNLDIAFATVSAHKIYGPKGIGALLTGPGLSDQIKPIIVGAGQQGGRRGGTMPTELIMGFGEACRLVSDNGSSERGTIAAIRNRFIKSLAEKRIASLIGSLERRHPGNALMHFPGRDASDLLARLQPKIAASTQSACSSGSIEPSHVLRAMGFDYETASECIRFSFGRFSNNEQADQAIRHIVDVLNDC
ncbi:cysteine desulfurase family protein [Sphingorhabdus sp. M41]|uniref:cysteine desulfurase family protein n=1 Tax=Sphingorhabdus sp. M41 TaxID=1806885 RepID=UPI00078E4ED7|nr:aminotransferase class V-fold PLP-dependent enzyme [Sphingorhabdus sp. M41]AMO71047.1 hypothetical protein AZE99_03500 [Sphingorhabdus sp. M41]